MKSSDALFSLSHSLRKGERSAFRRLGMKNSGDKAPRYLELFDLVLASAKYEGAKFRNELGMNDKQTAYSTLKDYLFKKILHFLRDNMAAQNSRMELRELLDEVMVLRSRSIFKAAEKRLSKARKIADRTEAFTYQLEISYYEAILALDNNDQKALKSWDKEIHSQTETQIRHLRDQFKFIGANLRYASWYLQMGSMESSRKKGVMQNLVHDENRKDEDFAASNNLLYHTHLGVVYSLAEHPEKALAARTKVDQLFSTSPALLRDRISQYSANLYNLSCSAVLLGEFDLAEKHLEKLEQVPQKFRKSSSSSYFRNTILRSAHLRAIILSMKGEWEKVQEISQDFAHRSKPETSGLSLQYQISILYLEILSTLFMGKNSESLVLISNLLNQKESELRKDMRLSTTILQVLIHDALGNSDLLEFLFRNVLRGISQIEDDCTFEKELLKYLGAKHNCNDSQKREKLRLEFVTKTGYLFLPGRLKRFDRGLSNQLIWQWLAKTTR